MELSTAQTRREREVARTRDDILNAAATAIARHGFDATTMQAIAKEAGYTAPSLYSYFKSKDEIVLGIFARMRDELAAVFDLAIPSGIAFRDRLDLVVRRQLELVDLRRDAIACFLALGPACGAAARPGGVVAPPDGFALHAVRVAAWLTGNASRDELGGHTPDDAACALLGIQHAFFRRWLETARDVPLASRTDLILNLFLNGISAPAASPREEKRKKKR